MEVDVFFGPLLYFHQYLRKILSSDFLVEKYSRVTPKWSLTLKTKSRLPFLLRGFRVLWSLVAKSRDPSEDVFDTFPRYERRYS